MDAQIFNSTLRTSSDPLKVISSLFSDFFEQCPEVSIILWDQDDSSINQLYFLTEPCEFGEEEENCISERINSSRARDLSERDSILFSEMRSINAAIYSYDLEIDNFEEFIEIFGPNCRVQFTKEGYIVTPFDE